LEAQVAQLETTVELLKNITFGVVSGVPSAGIVEHIIARYGGAARSRALAAGLLGSLSCGRHCCSPAA